MNWYWWVIIWLSFMVLILIFFAGAKKVNQSASQDDNEANNETNNETGRKGRPDTNENSEGGLKCTYCGGEDFYEGPSGGMSTNVMCANPKCEHWFNYNQGLIPTDDLHQIGRDRKPG